MVPHLSSIVFGGYDGSTTKNTLLISDLYNHAAFLAILGARDSGSLPCMFIYMYMLVSQHRGSSIQAQGPPKSNTYFKLGKPHVHGSLLRQSCFAGC